MGCTAVHQLDRLHGSVRPNQTFSVMELPAVLRCQAAYVRLLQRLYSQQEGTVLTDKDSDAFPIKRRTKQGDPLSSLLFNSVAIFFGERSETVARKQKGIRLSDKIEGCLTNLRFADDVLHISTSLERLRVQELFSKDYRLRHRLRLFSMVVTPTLTQKHETMFKTTQRKMLRLILQTKRKYKSRRDATNKKGRGDRQACS